MTPTAAQPSIRISSTGALLDALDNIRCAEKLMDRMMTHDLSLSQAEKLACINAELRSISSIIEQWLRQGLDPRRIS